ncbi:hypothetical protein [uncultured Enterococcus sp.]|uniref:hypothetical protein n=1 Tax=uncultured Enterococcus sp. TaxID=167972 RepID=UPI002AA8C8AC|nr:hypothetical protein [uncultured Enterococcus sp.]
MDRRGIQVKRYTLLYWLHSITSLVLLFIFSIAFFFCYFTGFQEKMTLAHLILLMLLILLAIFFRMNACHYQTFLWKEAEATKIRISRERMQQLRGDRRFYE